MSAFPIPFDDDLDLADIDEYEEFNAMMQEAEDRDARELQMLITGEIHQCAGCGCTELNACPGGCVWATDKLCSRCVA